MFRSLYRLVVLCVTLGGWGLAALSLHVVRTPDTIGLLPKDRLGFSDTYVDARKWTMNDVSEHPELVRRVLEANKAAWFNYLADPKNGPVEDQLSTAIHGASTQKADSGFDVIRTAADTAARSAGFSTASLPLDF